MKKIATIIGARPQFVKASIVSDLWREDESFTEYVIHTGQHFDENMSKVFFDELGMAKPYINLDIHGGNHGEMTGTMLKEIEKVLIEIGDVDLVLVYGDTNSTLAGALAAAKLHIPVAHVEAGLRSFNMKMPEEINRVLTDRISTLLFCPTHIAVENLSNEGLTDQESGPFVYNSGDVMFDVALSNSKGLEHRDGQKKDFILCTIHREENTNNIQNLKEIIQALNELNKKFEVVLPLHPRTKKKIDEFGLKLQVDTIDPVGYLEMTSLLKRCNLVLTDSGGLQKEAYFFEKKCVTVRDQTEWLELIEANANVLAAANSTDILLKVDKMMDRQIDFTEKLYGNGKASNEIVKKIKEYLS